MLQCTIHFFWDDLKSVSPIFACFLNAFFGIPILPLGFVRSCRSWDVDASNIPTIHMTPEYTSNEVLASFHAYFSMFESLFFHLFAYLAATTSSHPWSVLVRQVAAR